MARSPDVELRRWWRELIDAFDSTRETVGEFCRRHEVSPASFYRWRRDLARVGTPRRSSGVTDSSGATSPARQRRQPVRSKGGRAKAALGKGRRPPRRRRGAVKAVHSAAFVPVHVIPSEAASGLSSVHVRLPGGISIEVPVHQKNLLFELVAQVREHSSVDLREMKT